MQITSEGIQLGVDFTVQIIGLLAAWKQERSSTTNDHFQDFSIWLQNHNFHAIRERILESEELQRQLHSILEGSLDRIETRLDALSASVAELMTKIDGFRELERSISGEFDGLSSQACEILKLFAESEGATGMVVFDFGQEGKVLRMVPQGGSYRMGDQRFLDDDLEALEHHQLIRIDHYSQRDGNPVYALTRKGGGVAKSLPQVTIREGASK